MKKIFLLSLLSVLFLSAFSQYSNGNAEVLEKIYITASMNDDEGSQSMGRGFWIFFYKRVQTTYLPEGGVQITCTGWGLKMCVPRTSDLQSNVLTTLNPEIIDRTFEELVTESNELIGRGESIGTVSKKLQISDSNKNNYYLIFLMNWKNDPKKPYNGQAEITISKIRGIGF